MLTSIVKYSLNYKYILPVGLHRSDILKYVYSVICSIRFQLKYTAFLYKIHYLSFGFAHNNLAVITKVFQAM